MMRKTIVVLLGLVMLAHGGASADVVAEAQDLFVATQTVCSGISDEISKISNVSKINTAVTGVGTVAAGGALVAGVKKSQEEDEIDRLIDEMCKAGGCTPEGIESMSDEDFWNNVMRPMAQIAELQESIKDSETYGNWRTGLMAGTVGTNIASAIISGVNSNQTELIQHIQACNEAVQGVQQMIIMLKSKGVNPIENPIVNKLERVHTWCDKINISDIEKIEKRMKGVMGTAIAGGVIGVAGTATSAAANSDKYTDEKKRVMLNEQEQNKKDKLNTASNVMAGANVATGLVETGLNISLITLTKKLIKQAELCEEVFE